MDSKSQKTTTKFLEIKCNDCENVQVVFNKAATSVNCQICGAKLLVSTGGKSNIKGTVTGVLE